MLNKRTDALNGLVKDGFFNVESIARLFEIDRAIGELYEDACSELANPKVASMVRFLAELDTLAKHHYVSPRDIITLLDPDHFQKNVGHAATDTKE
jgi:hypothetical protein